MPAHLRTIDVLTCRMCQRFATCTLHNHQGDKIGDYCDEHGKKALAAALERDAHHPIPGVTPEPPPPHAESPAWAKRSWDAMQEIGEL